MPPGQVIFQVWIPQVFYKAEGWMKPLCRPYLVTYNLHFCGHSFLRGSYTITWAQHGLHLSTLMWACVTGCESPWGGDTASTRPMQVGIHQCKPVWGFWTCPKFSMGSYVWARTLTGLAELQVGPGQPPYVLYRLTQMLQLWPQDMHGSHPPIHVTIFLFLYDRYYCTQSHPTCGIIHVLFHDQCWNQWRMGVLGIVWFPTPNDPHSHGSWDKSKNPYLLRNHIILKLATVGDQEPLGWWPHGFTGGGRGWANTHKSTHVCHILQWNWYCSVQHANQHQEGSVSHTAVVTGRLSSLFALDQMQKTTNFAF